MSPQHYCSLTLQLLRFSKSRLTSCDTSVETSFPACNCDPTGTRRDENGTLICDSVGGQCECKANVIGQRCDRCAPGSFGFGSEGCTGKWNSTIRIFCVGKALIPYIKSAYQIRTYVSNESEKKDWSAWILATHDHMNFEVFLPKCTELLLLLSLLLCYRYLENKNLFQILKSRTNPGLS